MQVAATTAESQWNVILSGKGLTPVDLSEHIIHLGTPRPHVADSVNPLNVRKIYCKTTILVLACLILSCSSLCWLRKTTVQGGQSWTVPAKSQDTVWEGPCIHTNFRASLSNTTSHTKLLSTKICLVQVIHVVSVSYTSDFKDSAWK